MSTGSSQSKNQTPYYIIIATIILCILSTALFAVIYIMPFYINPPSTVTPTVTASSIPTQTPTPTSTPTQTPTPAPEPTQRPTTYEVQPGDTLAKIANLFQIPYEYLAAINNITDPNLIYSGQILTIPAEYIPMTPTPIAMVPGKMIYVVLSEQRVYVYEESVLLKTFIISSGIPGYDTVTGDYLIQTKLPSTTMSGPGYYLENVPWVMYFHLGYSFHGTYWHENFGVPMSHGCLNMRKEDAKWLYDWAPIGTLVRIVP